MTASPDVTFDPRSHDAVQSPFEAYRQARAAAPVYALAPDEFVVMGYDAASQVLRDPVTFPSTRLSVGPDETDPEVLATLAEGWPVPLAILELNGPEHALQRALVARAFTPRRVAKLHAPVLEIVDDLCKRIVPGEELDFRHRFSLPMSTRVMAHILGIDAGLLPTFNGWVNSFILQSSARVFTRDLKLVWAKAVVEFQHYMVGEFESRQAEPRDDLLTDLIQAYQAAGRIDDVGEMLRQALGLLVAGTETTSNALTSGMWLLLNHPARLAEIRSDLDLIPSLVEEVLRYEAPLRLRSNRVAARDTVLSGVPIPAGARVVVVVAAANRDERKFACPEEFDPGRPERPHLGFGLGVHFCLGAALARSELETAFRELLTRFAGFEAGPSQSGQVTYIAHSTFRAIEKLFLTFQARS